MKIPGFLGSVLISSTFISFKINYDSYQFLLRVHLPINNYADNWNENQICVSQKPKHKYVHVVQNKNLILI